MAIFSRAQADAALKEWYLPVVRSQLNETVKLLMQVERGSESVSGRRAVLSLHVRRNQGVGARADGATLPTPSSESYAEERVPLRNLYGRFEITGPTIASMESDRGSFERGITSQTKGTVNSLRRDVNRQLFGTSDGVIVPVAAVVATTAVTFATTATDTQKRQIEIGMVIDVGTATPFTDKATGLTITAVAIGADGVPTGFTVDSAFTAANLDSVVRTGSGGSGAAQKELTGLQTIINSSGALFNVNPSTEPSWQSLVSSNGGVLRPASETLFAAAIQNASIFGGSEIDQIVTEVGVHRNYAAQLLSEKRFANTIDLKGGYSAISINAGGMGEVALWWDRDCPVSTAFGISTGNLKLHEDGDWNWMDRDGSYLHRRENTDSYFATLVKYCELATDSRNSHLKISDLARS